MVEGGEFLAGTFQAPLIPALSPFGGERESELRRITRENPVANGDTSS